MKRLSVIASIAVLVSTAPMDAQARWKDRSNELPGFADQTELHVGIAAASALLVGLIVYLIVRDDPEEENVPDDPPGSASGALHSSGLPTEVLATHAKPGSPRHDPPTGGCSSAIRDTTHVPDTCLTMDPAFRLRLTRSIENAAPRLLDIDLRLTGMVSTRPRYTLLTRDGA
jgi:hypothetical protein